jgi:hypothetical protein
LSAKTLAHPNYFNTTRLTEWNKSNHNKFSLSFFHKFSSLSSVILSLDYYVTDDIEVQRKHANFYVLELPNYKFTYQKRQTTWN